MLFRSLRLDRIEKQVGAQTHLFPLDLTLVPRTVTVLLGATQAGKTTLMRLMAGLDVPSKGRVTADGKDVTGLPVRERNVAMVYQQFINYPSMTVADWCTAHWIDIPAPTLAANLKAQAAWN